MSDEQEQKEKLVELIREAIAHDEALRKKFEIGDRFRFVRDRLAELLDQLEKHVKSTAPAAEKVYGGAMLEDEALVYVYLYNAQGILVNTWQKIITPKLFFEYSVNRPIYADQEGIDSTLRQKANKVQHGYLTVIMKKVDILASDTKDTAGNTVVKIREGSLKFDRLVSFTHNDIEYTVNEEGEMKRKTPLP
jgi:hypothetical protein